jgi:hypothetical protein
MLKGIGGGSVIVDLGRMSLPASPLGRTGRPDLPARPTSTSPSSSSPSDSSPFSTAGSVGRSQAERQLDEQLRAQVLGPEISGSVGFKRMSEEEFQNEMYVAYDMGWMDVNPMIDQIRQRHIEGTDFVALAQKLIEENKDNIRVTEYGINVRQHQYIPPKVMDLMAPLCAKSKEEVLAKLTELREEYRKSCEGYEEADQLAEAYYNKASEHFETQFFLLWKPFFDELRPLLTNALTDYLNRGSKQ